MTEKPSPEALMIARALVDAVSINPDRSARPAARVAREETEPRTRTAAEAISDRPKTPSPESPKREKKARPELRTKSDADLAALTYEKRRTELRKKARAELPLKMGRPKSPPDETRIRTVIEALSANWPLLKALKAAKVDFYTWQDWKQERPDIAERESRALEAAADLDADDIIAIADAVADTDDHARVAAARLRCDVRRWRAGKRGPRYADRVEQRITGVVAHIQTDDERRAKALSLFFAANPSASGLLTALKPDRPDEASPIIEGELIEGEKVPDQ